MTTGNIFEDSCMRPTIARRSRLIPSRNLSPDEQYDERAERLDPEEEEVESESEISEV